LKCSAHNIARGRHRLGLQPEFKYHRDRHRGLLISGVAAAIFLQMGATVITGTGGGAGSRKT
jgi:hypothetical protein